MIARWRQEILTPTPLTADLPGCGGRLRCRPEDFEVREIPSYAPDGRDGHLLVRLHKRQMATHDAVAEVARQIGVSPREIGVAGRKDRDAVTEQWISVPAHAADALRRFAHPQIRLGPAEPHGHKLRMGHLRGNRFRIVIRALEVPIPRAIERVHAKVGRIAHAGGLFNVYGPQRFGKEGAMLERGLAAIAAGRGGPRGNMTVAAGQSALFNLWVAMRRDAGLDARVLLGDVLVKTDTGGMFSSEDPETDQARLDAGEVAITGPVFGSRMRAPPAGTPAARLELEALHEAGIASRALAALGRRAQGSRRRLRVLPDVVEVEPAAGDPDADLEPGIVVSFALPAGSYATTLCAELMDGLHRPGV